MIEQCEKCKHKEILYGGIVGCIFMDADCKKGEKYEPYTNADRIRAMSDEELAEWLEWFVLSTVDASGIPHDDFEDGEQDRLLCLLKQPFDGSEWL